MENRNIIRSLNISHINSGNISGDGGGKRHILDWLSPLESSVRHHDVRGTRADGVGDWLLHAGVFSAWRTLEDRAVKPILLCYGGPGVGKTYISSLVIDTLCIEISEDYAVVTCVYCDFSTENVQSPSTVLGSLLRQVVAALGHTPSTVKRAFERAKRQIGGLGLLLHEILEMLITCLSMFNRSYICIDSLDEFPLRHRPELWKSLQRVVAQCPNTRLFLTGRPHIRDEVRKCFPGATKMVHLSPSERDIGLYLRMRLSQDPEPDAMNERLRTSILTIIPERISGIFLLASLSMDTILAEATIHQRGQALDRIANGFGLQDAYNTTLDRIRQQGESKAALGMGALMWVSWCERPLKSEELRHALGVQLGAEDLSVHNVPSIQTILGCTLGLVTIDEDDSTVHLLHFTLQEYRRQHPTIFGTAHSIMAEKCLTYLNSQSVRALPPNPDQALAKQPFLEYATCFWGTHAASGMTDSVKSLALQFLDGYENHVSAAVFWQKEAHKRDFLEDFQGISGLHYIAHLGITAIAIPMLEAKIWDLNGRDSGGNTPLMWAVEYRNDKIVELFLEQGDLEPDMVVRDGRTVVSFAAESGNEGAVKLLLEREDVNPDSSDSNGRTPLSFAASGGHESVVKLLLERGDVNLDSPDINGRTPLSFATSGGHEGVVKLLLERRDANPASSDRNYQLNHSRLGFPFSFLTSILFTLTFFGLLTYYGL